jgi:hypothetical protein
MAETRIRGKRKRPEPSHPDGIGQPRSRGRPMKRVSELLSSKRSLQQHGCRDQTHHQGILPAHRPDNSSTPSHLERLPVELIQHIFFLALEPNMAHASTSLLKALSQDTIYKALILFAFFDDDGKHPVETRHFLPAKYRLLDVQEKLRLQKSILKCSWCNLRRLQGCLPILARLKIVQMWHIENEQDQLFTQDKSIIITSQATLPNLEDTEDLERHFLVKTTFENNSESMHYLPRIVTWSYVKAAGPKKAMVRSYSILAVRHIPDRLLSGEPWTADKLRLLQLLRQGHRFIRTDFILSLSFAAMFQGMASAIKEHNIPALMTLLELHNTVSYHRYPHLHPIPLELFHLASKELDRSSELIQILLREGIQSIPKNDVILTSWAVRNGAAGDKVAQWLLKHMEGTRSQDFLLFANGRFNPGQNSSLLTNGRLNPSCSGDIFPFPQHSFTEELNYLTFGSVSRGPLEVQE